MLQMYRKTNILNGRFKKTYLVSKWQSFLRLWQLIKNEYTVDTLYTQGDNITTRIRGLSPFAIKKLKNEKNKQLVYSEMSTDSCIQIRTFVGKFRTGIKFRRTTKKCVCEFASRNQRPRRCDTLKSRRVEFSIFQCTIFCFLSN